MRRTGEAEIWIRRLVHVCTQGRSGTTSIRCQLEVFDHEFGAGFFVGTLQYDGFVMLQSRKILLVPARLRDATSIAWVLGVDGTGEVGKGET